MNIKDGHIDKVCSLLDLLVGNVTFKNLFTGYGLFHKEETMFAIWQNKKLYLRGEDELATQLIKLGCEPFTTNELNKRFVLSQYYALTEQVLRNNMLCRKLIILSIKQIIEQKLECTLRKLNRLKDLPNLTIKHERALIKVGITDVMMLREIGAENALVELKKNGSGATLDFYWKLVCALQNKNSQMLSQAEKERLLKKLNEVLRKNGLKGYRKLDDE
ncbi:TPA: DNA transformation protein TfoX [Haemophilus influenzae]|uniref:DNA transformation protein TfoX n=1 Tax=Haemophilus influenzae TaxID=727 RepID=A0AAX3IPP3_HAEIF|nr:DNA transformation protein TfoX [Haemophilus influenzae]AXH82605.1 DNA transformation protein [Haemophilus influenzae]MCK8810300.1 DNA transformation protein TfoX [Haemophilus influenzae]MCK8884866.1 DNA transformation protein TfoX [Haemophilus influenzae]MCK9048477.1 DNA transformation protein TfoX [Haemophilus influenzae]NKB29807.1 TfoX family DNA transformation protein [Haemophilus influenzae]